jgi:arabinofuranan 3-O-arabinosyltransferase
MTAQSAPVRSAPDRPPGIPPTPAEPSSSPGPGIRWFLLVWLLALLVLAANHSGRMVFDTKLGVDIDPATFYARLWHLWNPLEWLGTLQDQYIGYAFPMAPFYLVAHVAGVPVWLTERLWMSLLIAVGFLGLARLAAALRIGSPRSRLLAGLAFALWPTFTILVGSTSVSILPGLLAPWAVLPLVPAVRRGSVTLAAARSGLAVLCMGGVNAAVTLEALILPGLYILVYARGKRRAALASCWALAVILATSWWAGPLLLQGRYSFNFLPYIEQAATTTRTMSATAALLGAGNWTAYFNLGTPWLTAGWTMISAPAAVLASALAAAAGLFGLARRDLPQRAWLRLSAAVAAAGALAGYGGPLGGPFHAPAGRLLDGPLAPLRNVYKFESVLALVLALGVAHGLAALARRAGRRSRTAGRRLLGLAAGPAVVLVLAGLALPYLSDQVLNPGSFAGVPRYWYQVADFLAAHSPREPAFVVPADSHGIYTWGSPIDDPLEPLARSPWVERGLVPFGSAGSQIFLDTAETAMESGEQVAGLSGYLARAGIRYVVVRNDLSPSMVGYTPPQVVHETLAQSGFRRVAAFGPRVAGGQSGSAAAAAAQLPGTRPAYPAVEVYAARDAAGGAGSPGRGIAVGPAQVLPTSQTVLVDGGPDSLLQLTGQGISAGRPAVLAGDRPGASPDLLAVTDGLRRGDNAFGLITANVSETYTATQTNPPDDQLGDASGPPRQILPGPARRQTVAVLSGAAAVTASSVGSWLTEAPQYDPVNAFDGNPATAWAAGVPGSAAGQWVQVTFHHRRALSGSARIRLLAGPPARSVPTSVTVSTAAGRVSTPLRPVAAIQPLRIPPGRTGWLRVTIASTRGHVAGPAAGLRDVLIPGVRVRRFLQPAQDQAGADAAGTSSEAFSFQQQLPSPALLANAAAYSPLARTFVTSGSRRLRMTATAVALPGRELTALLARLTPVRRDDLQVSATSTLGSLPSLAAANLLRGTQAGPWIAASAHPVLRISWRGRRRISELVLTPDSGRGAVPSLVRVDSPAGVREAAVGFGGLVTLGRPLVTDQLSISFPASQPASAAASAAAPPAQLPIALSRLSIPALADLRPAVPPSNAAFSLPCGQGPAVTVDGRSYATAVSGRTGALMNFQPVQVRLCTAGSTLGLAAGRHWLTAPGPAPFEVTGISLTAGPAASPRPATAAAAAARTINVVSWQAESRSLRIGPGQQSYLEIHQNISSGWVATLDGSRLTPVRLDGWQQGYLLPAGRGGLVVLSFAPARLYHVLLAAAALGVLLLLAAALPRRRRGRGAAQPAARPAPDQAGADTWPTRHQGSRSPELGAWIGVAAICGLVFAVGGLVACVVPALAVLASRWPRWLPAVAAVGILAAGVVTATAANPTTVGIGAFSATAQVCALVALAAALMPATRHGRGSRHPSDPLRPEQP